MTMLDKAAAAAWPFLWDATDTATPAHDAARARMRAALQAIRELTPGVLAHPDMGWKENDEISATWSSVIDAILSGEA
jgi:hypothetical protein